MGDKLRDILVVCDMDGTLLDSACTISQANLETIRLFVALGGNFTVATGRTVSSVAMYPELAQLLAPAITSGGCVLYDFKQKKPVKSILLPPLAGRQALRDIVYKFPHVGAMVMAANMRAYQVQPSPTLDLLLADEKMDFFHCPYEDLPDDWNKVVFAAEPDTLTAVRDYVSTRTYPGVHFMQTNARYLEILPKNASKGNALQQLCKLMSISPKNTYVIGDYYNDVDVMQQAGYAVAMDNAPPDVKREAKEVTASNDESGVGQFLYKLIKQYEAGR